MLYIDDRIGAKELSSEVKSPHIVKRLDYADVMFLGNGPTGPVSIGIERKRFRDLMNSMQTGRLSGHQLIGLKNSYDYVFLLIEGAFKIGKDGYLRRPKGKAWVVERLGDRSLPSSYMYNYLLELSIFAQVIVIFQFNIQCSALWIDGVYSWFQRSWESHHAHAQFEVDTGKEPSTFDNIQRKPKLLVRMIKEIEGVGWVKAKALGRKYSDVVTMAFAEAEELTEVKGIGKELARRIGKALRTGEEK